MTKQSMEFINHAKTSNLIIVYYVKKIINYWYNVVNVITAKTLFKKSKFPLELCYQIKEIVLHYKIVVCQPASLPTGLPL